MRTFILSRPGPTPPPPEMMPALLQAFKAWRGRWRPKMENFEFFRCRRRWLGSPQYSRRKELSQAMMEYPFAPFSVIEALPTVDGDEALDRVIQTMDQMMAAMKP